MKKIKHFITTKLDKKFNVGARHVVPLQHKKILITVTDITRACPDKLILDILLDYLIKKGALKKNINIIIATGLHRGMTDKEIMEKYGSKARKFNIKNHDALKDLLDFGKINGVKIQLNKSIKNADIIFSIGIIEPHHYAGFSGGAKSVAIGIAGESLINHTHSYEFITNKNVSIGNLKNNPFQKFLWDVIANTGKDFNFINVILQNKKIKDCAFGSTFSDYSGFIAKNKKNFVKKTGQKYDAAVLNISGGKSTNFYQASRAFTYIALTHNSIVKNNGVIILNSKMEEGFGRGLGEERFAEILKKSKNLDDLVKNVKVSKCGGVQRAILFSEALRRHKLIIIRKGTARRAPILNVLKKFGVEIFDKTNVGAKGSSPLRGKKIIEINDPFSKLYVK